MPWKGKSAGDNSIFAPCTSADLEIGNYHSHPDTGYFSTAGDNAANAKKGDRETAAEKAKNGLGPTGLVRVTRLGTGVGYGICLKSR